MAGAPWGAPTPAGVPATWFAITGDTVSTRSTSSIGTAPVFVTTIWYETGSPTPFPPVCVFTTVIAVGGTAIEKSVSFDAIRVTDLHQGIVWGTNTALTEQDPRLTNRFDYDVVGNLAACRSPLAVDGTDPHALTTTDERFGHVRPDEPRPARHQIIRHTILPSPRGGLPVSEPVLAAGISRITQVVKPSPVTHSARKPLRE